MKALITESRFENLVIRYLDEMFYPDHGWANPDVYRKDVDRWGDLVFFIDDVDSYIYYGCNANAGPEDEYFAGYGHLHNYECPLLSIYPRVSEKLRDMFGNKWKPIFKEWFESNTGLNVEQITDDYI